MSRLVELESRIEELESMLEYAVDAGWADGLVRALVDVAEGRKHHQEIARRALEKAGLWPASQLTWWDGSEVAAASGGTLLDTFSLSHGLIIRPPWVARILDGHKTWEIRGTNTQIRGPIALIPSGSGCIVGVVQLVDVRRLSLDEFRTGALHHAIQDADQRPLPYPACYAWVLQNPVRLPQPTAYTHPRGAVRWVRFQPPLAVTTT